MKSIKRRPRNPFTGKWKVLSLHCNVHGQGWMLFKVYGRNSYIWDFTDVGKITFPSGSVTYSGRIWELCRNCEPGQTDFFYYPATKQLYIDRSDFIENGFVDICTEDRYLVERINADDLWLYDLNEMDEEVAEYRFKMKLRRIKDDRL